MGIQIQHLGAAEPHFYMIVSDRCSQLMRYILVIIVVFCEREGITLGTCEIQLKLKHIFNVHSSLKMPYSLILRPMLGIPGPRDISEEFIIKHIYIYIYIYMNTCLYVYRPTVIKCKKNK